MFDFTYNNLDFAHKLDQHSHNPEDFLKHIHPFYEILYFVSGDVTYTVESESQKLSEGDIVLILPGKYHFASVNLNEPYERYVLKFPCSIVPDFVSKKLAESSAFYIQSKKFSVMFNQLDTFAPIYSDEEIYALFVSEVTKLLVMLCHENAPSQNRRHNNFISALINYIDENITSPLTAQSLANEFHYSKSFINIEFKKHMKIPIMQYVRSKKIMAAHNMIISGAKKSETAELFGFETYSTFYRAYKKLIHEHSEQSQDS